MNFFLIIYSLLSSLIFLLIFPFFAIYTLLRGKHREELRNRLGCYRRDVGLRAEGTVRIWVHAASGGEVSAAAPVIKELTGDLPGADIILSTTTVYGHRAAREVLGDTVTCVFAPVDFIAAVALALQTVKPDILVFVETEIWPNWLFMAHLHGIRTVMVNGRISVRSVKGYQRVRPLIGPILDTMAAFSMVRKQDAGRLRSLGVPEAKIEVNGNAKYDRLTGMATLEARLKIETLYGLAGNKPVLVAGSIRSGEEALSLDVFLAVRKKLPDLVCIVAPRHMNRAARLAARADSLGIEYQMRSGLDETGNSRKAPVVILDTLGELQATYSIATVVFCGGSLVPLGGQNVLEAAAWGKPVLFGPSMEDFQTEKELLIESGGGIEVADRQELVRQALFYLSNPEEAERAGRAGQAAVYANTGAARKHADVILRHLEINF
jgi:3-deoxy-D-manno-octulosonic-acid transferase